MTYWEIGIKLKDFITFIQYFYACLSLAPHTACEINPPLYKIWKKSLNAVWEHKGQWSLGKRALSKLDSVICVFCTFHSQRLWLRLQRTKWWSELERGSTNIWLNPILMWIKVSDCPYYIYLTLPVIKFSPLMYILLQSYVHIQFLEKK